MTTSEPDGRAKRYTLKPVVKPLRGKGDVRPKDGKGVFGTRAENEDDDGYDPYSDFHDGNAGPASFEPDPWR